MWPALSTFFIAAFSSSIESKKTSVFTKEHIIFSSSFNITKLLVPADEFVNIHADSSSSPSIFFTVSDPKLEGGACIYVLDDFAAYEIMEGGKDSTADYSTDRNVYFGARDGLYKFDHDSLSATKLGPFTDDIIQLQKANGTDKFYILTHNRQLFILENNGTIRTRINNVVCAKEFVLDTSNNIYFVECGSQTIRIIKSNGAYLGITGSYLEEFEDIKLIRPAFIMDSCIPFLGDGTLYILYANGTCEKKDIAMVDKPSALSVDVGLYLVAAVDGNIYEFNVMDILLQSMFKNTTSSEVKKMINYLMENAKDGMFSIRGFTIS